jgi:hypothetical protein
MKPTKAKTANFILNLWGIIVYKPLPMVCSYYTLLYAFQSNYY